MRHNFPDGLLANSGGVDSGNQTLNDYEVVVDDLGQWSQTIYMRRLERLFLSLL